MQEFLNILEENKLYNREQMQRHCNRSGVPASFIQKAINEGLLVWYSNDGGEDYYYKKEAA